MLRVICFGTIDDPAAAEDIVDAGRRVIVEDPDIIGGEFAASKRLWENRAPHPHYSWILDFADEAAWDRFQTSEPHDRFMAVVRPHLRSAMVTQYDVDPTQPSPAERAVDEYVRCINEGRYSDVGKLFAEDGSWVGQVHEPVHGRDALIAFYEQFLSERRPTVRAVDRVASPDVCIFVMESFDRDSGEYVPGPLDHVTVDSDGKISRFVVYRQPITTEA